MTDVEKGPLTVGKISYIDERHSRADVRLESAGGVEGRSRYCETATSSGTSCMIPVCVNTGVERANEILDNGLGERLHSSNWSLMSSVGDEGVSWN